MAAERIQKLESQVSQLSNELVQFRQGYATQMAIFADAVQKLTDATRELQHKTNFCYGTVIHAEGVFFYDRIPSKEAWEPTEAGRAYADSLGSTRFFSVPCRTRVMITSRLVQGYTFDKRKCHWVRVRCVHPKTMELVDFYTTVQIEQTSYISSFHLIDDDSSFMRTGKSTPNATDDKTEDTMESLMSATQQVQITGPSNHASASPQ